MGFSRRRPDHLLVPVSVLSLGGVLEMSGAGQSLARWILCPLILGGQIMSGLAKLLANSTLELCSKEPALTDDLRAYAGPLADDLLALLRRRNGFYALEGALHVFPSGSCDEAMGLDVWNSGSLWRNEYHGMADGCLFFAEDIFGGQFCIKGKDICTFDPETGALDILAKDIEGWAKAVVSDYNVLTGYPLAHAWQKQNGLLEANMRLLPKIPFVAGGEFTVDNLHAIDAVKGMHLRADIANQIKGVPNGGSVKFTVKS